MKKPVFNIGENIYYYNKWENEIQSGEIINIRKANLNWDYSIRYQIYSDMYYINWIQEDHIARDEQILFRFLN